MDTEANEEAQSPDVTWDDHIADQLLGSLVLIGLTYVDPEDTLIRQEQFWGRPVHVDRQAGIQIELRGARAGHEDFWLPPDTRPFQPATQGEYNLRSTGEVVVNPDFTAAWTITEGHQ